MGTDLKGKQLGRGLSQRKDGRYMARYTKRNGERPTYYSFKLQECKKWLADEQYADERGEDNRFKNSTLDEWFDFWLDQIKKDNLSVVTHDGYRRVYEGIIKPFFGWKKICKITSVDYIDWINWLQSKNSSQRENVIKNSTKKRYISLFCTIMKDAKEFNVIDTSPCKCRKAPRATSDEKSYLTYSGQKLFEETAKRFSYYDHFIFVLNTGLRIGELRGLKWEDVDWINKRIHVSRSVKVLENPYRYIIGDTKTKNSIRTIPLTMAALQCLQHIQKEKRKQKVVSAEWKDFIFTSKKTGNPVCSESYRWQLDRICEIIKIPRITMHSLRHTFATRCLESGMNPKVLSTIMGHASISITIDTYVHTEDCRVFHELSKFESYLDTNDPYEARKNGVKNGVNIMTSNQNLPKSSANTAG